MSIKGLAYVSKKRTGKPTLWYVYAYRGGPLILSTVGGSRPSLTPAAVAAYHEAMRETRAAPSDTLAALCAEWRASREWAAFADDTKRQWGYRLSAIQEAFGTVPLAVFEDRQMRRDILSWRDAMGDHPRKADYHVQVLRGLLKYGVVHGRVALNLADGIPSLYRGGNRAAIIWTPIERWVMGFGLSQQTSDAFRLACLTGFRRAELAGCPMHAVGDHAIVWATQKSARENVVTVPMIEPLRELVAELRTRHREPGVASILVNSRGRQWTPDGLDSSFGDERDRIGFDKHLHDCRGTYATELMEAGLTDVQIAGILGWSTARVADIRRLYVDQERTVVAIGEAISRRFANRAANR